MFVQSVFKKCKSLSLCLLKKKKQKEKEKQRKRETKKKKNINFEQKLGFEPGTSDTHRHNNTPPSNCSGAPVPLAFSPLILL